MPVRPRAAAVAPSWSGSCPQCRAHRHGALCKTRTSPHAAIRAATFLLEHRSSQGADRDMEGGGGREDEDAAQW